jgi:hypothetical protein
LETKASIEKAIQSVAEPLSNGKLANKAPLYGLVEYE